MYGEDYLGLCSADPGPCPLCASLCAGRPCGRWEGHDGARFCPHCGWARRYHSEPQWQITVRVPMRLTVQQRHELVDAIAHVAYNWEPADRDGWDIDVSAGEAPHV